MTVSVQRDRQFRYMTTAVHMRSISVHAFWNTILVHAKYHFGTVRFKNDRQELDLIS